MTVLWVPPWSPASATALGRRRNPSPREMIPASPGPKETRHGRPGTSVSLRHPCEAPLPGPGAHQRRPGQTPKVAGSTRLERSWGHRLRTSPGPGRAGRDRRRTGRNVLGAWRFCPAVLGAPTGKRPAPVRGEPAATLRLRVGPTPSALLIARDHALLLRTSRIGGPARSGPGPASCCQGIERGFAPILDAMDGPESAQEIE